MVAAGFYYPAHKYDIFGKSWNVSCGIKLIYWMEDDGKMTEHIKWVPNCYVKDNILNNRKRCIQLMCL